MLLGQLIEGLDLRLSSPGHAGVRICDITEDSRTVLPGSLYIARKGESADGNTFIPQAIDAGAVAVLSDDPHASLPALPHHPPVALLTGADIPFATAALAERFYGDPSSRLTVFGVTGTNGKTTTTYLIHQILNALHIRAGLMGTVFIDDGVEVAAAAMTTPPALEVSRTLARMLEAGCRAAVVEVSSHSLDQRRVAGLKFDAAAFSNLTGDHLDYHKDMDSYAAAKARLFESLPTTGAAIINAEDPWAVRMVRDCRAPVWAASIGANRRVSENLAWPPISATVRKATRWGTDVTLTGPWGSVDAALPFVGPHNIMNALQAAALVWAASRRPIAKPDPLPPLEMPAIAAALASAALPPGRLQLLTAPRDPITVYVDYAHTDDALRTVLSVFREIAPRQGDAAGRIIVVFGCGGDRDRTKRPRMGAVAAAIADRIYVTSDNPRTEQPRAIIDAIVSGMPGDAWQDVVIEPDREKAIHAAIAEARDGDIVIIAGKGHEDYQILPAPPDAPPGSPRTVKRFFDDRLVARDALAARGIRAVNPQPTITVRHGQGHHARKPAPTSRTESP